MAVAGLLPRLDRAGLTLMALATAALLAGCSSAAPSGSSSAPPGDAVSAAPSAAVSPTGAPSLSPAASQSEAPLTGATAVPTALDPCSLIPAAEASTLAGVTFGQGKESTTSGNGRICTYGAQTTNVFMVEVAQAPDEATAKADEAAAEAALKAQAATLASKGLQTTELPNLAPGADGVLLQLSMSVGGSTIGGGAIYVLKGTTFFGFSDLSLNHAPPTADAMKAEAIAVLTRPPLSTQ